MLRTDSLRLEVEIKNRIEQSVAVQASILGLTGQLARVADLLISAYLRGRKVLLFGNGGSAADAQHLAAELVGRFSLERTPLPAIALTVNTSSLTAIGNDHGFDEVFARQINAFGVPGDVAIGISTSGNSPNVIRGIQVARHLGMVTVALTGAVGGKLANEVDECIRIPSTIIPRIQEGHLMIGHILFEMIELALFKWKEA
jgi:D-sedoheptulose 7-phosphate isomerase